ncbi:methyltransferase domain-containing protein [Pseudodesulfovibrio pelocollis]|uniref:methyltransferase domain-containing protein n=1 Tax=Pseudodesulfovibrio pelocollis TaxID=3051432 RepID=UPI00255A8A4C|nr:class I SAM-dependent methyltransferase [Pseudodesulfovibrio sp. SB368]
MPDRPETLPHDCCPVCRTAGAPVYHERSTGEVFHRCRECGLLFIDNSTPDNPYPVEALSVESQETGFASDYRSNKLWNYARSHVRWIISYLERLGVPASPRALSVGCAFGHDLRELGDLGWQVLGVDHDKGFAVRAKNQHGVEVRTGFFESVEVHGQWDLVVLASVLPYLSGLDKVMRKVKSLVKPGGYMFITVREIDWCEPAQVLEYSMNRHARQYFPSSSLERLCKEYGFDPVVLDRFAMRLPWSTRLANANKLPILAKPLQAIANVHFRIWNALGGDAFRPAQANRAQQLRLLARRTG